MAVETRSGVRRGEKNLRCELHCGIAPAGGFVEVSLPLSRFEFCEGVHGLVSRGDLVQDRLCPCGCIRCETFYGCLDARRKPFRKSLRREFTNSLLSE